MAESEHIHDVEKEDYLGPSEVVAALGEGAAAHYGTGLLGLGVGGVLGAIFTAPVNNMVTGWKQAAVNWSTSSSKFLKGLAPALKWLVGTPDGTYLNKMDGVIKHHDLFRELLKGKETGIIHEFAGMIRKTPVIKNLSQPKLEAVIAAGGILGVIGFFVAPIYFMFTGVKHASEGREQFKRTKTKVIETKVQYEALEKKYAEAKIELDDIKAQTAQLPANEGEIAKIRDDRSQRPAPQQNAQGWTPGGQVEDPRFPQQPHYPWGDKVGSKAKTDGNWKEAVRASQAEAATETKRN